MTLIPKRWHPVAVAALATLVVSSVGATVTDLGPWYQSLQEPSWRPPDRAFGLIWTVIFALATLSAIFAWRDTKDDKRRYFIVGMFAANGFLNVLWSIVFFQLRRPDFSLVEVGALWLSLIVLIIATARDSWRSSILIVPYLIWVTLAAVLNYDVVRLNGPFG